MLDVDIDLMPLIAQGESDTLEFTERLPPEPTVSTILAAFANTNGGTWIIGVRDTGEVIGLPKKEAAQTYNKLNRIAGSLLSEPFDSGTTSLNGKWLVYIKVGQVPKHLYPVITSTGKYYKRYGARSVRVVKSNLFREGDIEEIPAGLVKGGGPVGAEDTKARGGGGDIQSKAIPAKTFVVFVAMSFRQEEEPALVDYYRAMERAAEKTKLPVRLTRMDLVEGDYEISQKLMDDIDKADIVIADFTLRPANVYFELGYARGMRKRIIQTARKDTALEFDIRNWRTVFYRNATELEEKLVLALDTACSEVDEAGG